MITSATVAAIATVMLVLLLPGPGLRSMRSAMTPTLAAAAAAVIAAAAAAARPGFAFNAFSNDAYLEGLADCVEQGLTQVGRLGHG
jgi:hypothetical protein